MITFCYEVIYSDKCVISAKRERIPDEIIPDSVKHSGTVDNNEEKRGAGLVIDLDLGTYSGTVAGSDGKSWMKINLAELNCIQRVIEYVTSGNSGLIYTCSSSDCSNCEGSDTWCKRLPVTISSERTSSDDLILIADCKYGDTVKLEEIGGTYFPLTEIAITGKPGEMRYR